MFDTTTQAGRVQIISLYKSEVSSNPDLSFKTFCDNHNISDYKKLLWWCNDQGISIYALQGKRRLLNSVRQSEETFIQFVPSGNPASCNLRGVSITFPDGVNLTFQECSVESAISLLSIYQSRQGGSQPCSD